MQYSINIDAFDKDEDSGQLTRLNLMDFDSMEDLINKKMKLTVDIRKATGIPEKYSYMTKCKYNLFEEEKYETKEIAKMKEPEFNHKKEITFDITEELLSSLKAKTLTMEVYGKIEPKKNNTIN